jgi:3-oxoacyl-[acyl-carrier protein] reductase
MSRDVLLITGASSDLGLALIRRLCDGPTPPLVLAHVNAGLERVQGLGFGPDVVRPVVADLSDGDAVLALADEIMSAHGVPSQVVHLPGLPLVYERFTKFKWDHFQRDLDIQVKSAVLLLTRLLPKMAKLPRAKIAFVLSSVTRDLPPKYLAMYTVVKHAQLGLMKALASEYAGTKVTVNAVSPSMIDTRFIRNLPEVAVNMAAESSPHKRHASVADVVGAIAFLLSPDSDYMTGVELPLTAGSTG